MGLKKNWWWDKEDWDQRIQEDGIYVHATDLPHLNSTEMVEILNLLGIRAHRGMSKAALHDIFVDLRSGCGAPDIIHPIDAQRDVIVSFLKVKWEKVRDQLLSHCHGNCYLHHDVEVISCYEASKEILEEKHSDVEGEEF